MSTRSVAVKPIQWGIRPQVTRRGEARRGQWLTSFLVVLVAVSRNAPVAAQPSNTSSPSPPDRSTRRSPDGLQPVEPDAPARRDPIVVPPSNLPSTASLDAIYLWLGPVGAASYVDHAWDSTFGVEAAVISVHEDAPLGALGITAGASRWTARGGGRVWVDGLAGTHLGGQMIGASLGPILELSDLAHPRIGASIGVWGFAGITPFARVGTVSGLGMFAELGIHIDLPVLRR